MVFNLIITLDDELPAGGRGDVLRSMVRPTARLLEICEAHGAPLTIMIELGEVWAFLAPENETFARALGYDPAREIWIQLGQAVARGHDVQLHLHPQWIGARWSGNEWRLDYAHYRLTDFSEAEMVALLQRGRAELEQKLKPFCPAYACVGFRAGHWNTQPSDRYLAALWQAGFQSDTSVFKGGQAHSRAVGFDYRAAHSAVRAWVARWDDINQPGAGEGIIEAPIATRWGRLTDLLTVKRLWLARRYLLENRRIEAAVSATDKDCDSPSSTDGRLKFLRKILGRHPLKLDFCKLSARQMVSMVDAFIDEYDGADDPEPIPLIMIGHSKQIGSGRDLDRFLNRALDQFGDRLRTVTYRQFIASWKAAHVSPMPALFSGEKSSSSFDGGD